MIWRLIELEKSDAFTNMAIDEALTFSVGKKKSPPTIRFYQWSPAAVSLGYFQKASDVNVKFCEEQKIDCVRRLTGGSAVLHELSDLTYSVIAPQDFFPKDLLESYKEICSWMLLALKNLGINAVLEKNDLRVAGRKISGNAQARVNGVLLQHGTLIFEFDCERTMKVLNLRGKEELVKKEITSVFEEGNLKFGEVYEEVKVSFMKGKRFKLGTLSGEEKLLVKKLVEEKYRTSAWNGSIEGKERGPCYLRLNR